MRRLSIFIESSQSADRLLKFALLCKLLQHQVTGYGTRDLNLKSAEVDFYHYARPYSNELNFESRSREKPSFRTEFSVWFRVIFFISAPWRVYIKYL